MKPLIHGGDVTSYTLQFQGRVPLDFSANLNPLGMPEPVRAALHAAVEDCVRYPDPLCRALIEALAARWQLRPEQIFCGNGAADIFDRLATILCPKTALLAVPSFFEYEKTLSRVGCDLQFYVLDKNEDFTVTERILQDITEKIDAIYLCSPNNPTGRLIPPELLDKIAARCAETGTWLIIDECFGGFIADDKERSMRRWLERYDRLIVVRAFTKVYALAGVRLGWCMTQKKEIIERLREVGQPWNVSHLAQRAGLAALGCDSFVRETVRYIKCERMFLIEGLSSLGMRVCPSSTNFILFYSENKDISKYLYAKGILLRDCSNFRGLEAGWYRTAVRNHDENQRLLWAIQEVLHG